MKDFTVAANGCKLFEPRSTQGRIPKEVELEINAMFREVKTVLSLRLEAQYYC